MKRFTLWTSYTSTWWSGTTYTYNTPVPQKLAEFTAHQTEIKDGLVRLVGLGWETIAILCLDGNQWLTSEEIPN